MIISSRTPEGEPNVCPLCGVDFQLEPSSDTGDGTCPACGHLVWFTEYLAADSERRIKQAAADSERRIRQATHDAYVASCEAGILHIVENYLGPFPAELQGRLTNLIEDYIKLGFPNRVPLQHMILEAVLKAKSWTEVIGQLGRSRLKRERSRIAGEVLV